MLAVICENVSVSFEETRIVCGDVIFDVISGDFSILFEVNGVVCVDI